MSKCIEADALELEYRRMKDAESLGEHSGGYVYKRLFETLLQAPEAFPAGWPEWIRTAERKPTAEDANEDGCVLSINTNPGDMNTTNWPWNMVAAFPENLPVWMPLPKKPGERPQKLYWREEAATAICPLCGYSCNDDYYLDKFCPGCGTRLYFDREETEHDQPDM